MKFNLIKVCSDLGIADGPVVMEMGAGHFLTCMPIVGIAREYILVDPIVEHVERWRAHFTADPAFKGKLTVHNVAVTTKSGLMEMCVAPAVSAGNKVGNRGISLVASDYNLSRESYATWEKRTVLGVTFDTIDPGNIDFLLLDVEGHELPVLKGMISRPKAVLVEIWHGNPTRRETLDLFHSYGYSLRRKVGWDYLFVHNAQPGEVATHWINKIVE